MRPTSLLVSRLRAHIRANWESAAWTHPNHHTLSDRIVSNDSKSLSPLPHSPFPIPQIWYNTHCQEGESPWPHDSVLTLRSDGALAVELPSSGASHLPACADAHHICRRTRWGSRMCAGVRAGRRFATRRCASNGAAMERRLRICAKMMCKCAFLACLPQTCLRRLGEISDNGENGFGIITENAEASLYRFHLLDQHGRERQGRVLYVVAWLFRAASGAALSTYKRNLSACDEE